MGESFDDDGLSVLLCVPIEHITHEVIDALTRLLAELYSLLNPLARCGIVLLVVVEIRVHE